MEYREEDLEKAKYLTMLIGIPLNFALKQVLSERANNPYYIPKTEIKPETVPEVKEETTKESEEISEDTGEDDEDYYWMGDDYHG